MEKVNLRDEVPFAETVTVHVVVCVLVVCALATF